MAKDWPWLIDRPGPGQVRACPICGNVAIFTCYHDDTGTISTEIMNAARAAWLRRMSGEYDRMERVCQGCGYEGPIEVGSSISNAGGWRCARCSGRTEKQVAAARRQVT